MTTSGEIPRIYIIPLDGRRGSDKTVRANLVTAVKSAHASGNLSSVMSIFAHWIDGLKASSYLYFAFSLCLSVLCCTSALAANEAGIARPDPKELIGTSMEGHNYPYGWRGIGNPYFDAKHSLDGQTIYKKNSQAFILRKILTERTNSTPRRTVVVDAVQLRLNLHKAGDLFISECKHPSIQETSDQRIFAEVRFRKCERYSSRVSAAWLIDSASKKISPISPKGMRCVDTFFNNGPDGSTCPPIPAEW